LLASRGASVTAFDYSKEMLELSRQIALREGFRLRFARGDAAETGLRENAFDAASCMRFFIHVEKPAAYLRELARVTRGPIVFDTVNSRSLKFFQAVFVNAFKKTLGYSYMSVFSENEVCGEVERAGLTVAEVRKEFFFPQAVYRFLPFPLARELKKFDDALLRLTGGRLACAHYWKTRKNEKTGKK